MTSKFKDKDFKTRCDDSQRIREKYPDRIPVIVEKDGKTDLPDLDKKKFLVPYDLSFGNFLYIIRKRIQLSPEFGLYVFANNTLPRIVSTMGDIYNDYKDQDGFLYLIYSGESTYGDVIFID